MKLDHVRKKVKKNTWRLHITYFVSIIILLSIGFVLGSEMQIREQEKRKELGSRHTTEVYRLTDIINRYQAMVDSIPLGFPTESTKINSKYGYRYDPIYKTIQFHHGIDIKTKYLEPVMTTADGTISFAGWMGGYGKCVVVDHSNGVSTLYAHLQELKVKSGRAVTRGDVLGLSGSTGKSSGIHLHYEILKDNTNVNPQPFLKILELEPSISDQEEGKLAPHKYRK